MSSKETLYLQTTQVSATKSLGEIVAELAKRGASSTRTLYDAGEPTGLEWSMLIYGRVIYFRLPVKVEPVYQALRKRSAGYVGAAREKTLREQAERIAWRQMLAWVRLQMALVELGMVEYAQVFLPFAIGDQNQTMWDVARQTHFKQIEGPKQ